MSKYFQKTAGLPRYLAGHKNLLKAVSTGKKVYKPGGESPNQYIAYKRGAKMMGELNRTGKSIVTGGKEYLSPAELKGVAQDANILQAKGMKFKNKARDIIKSPTPKTKKELAISKRKAVDDLMFNTVKQAGFYKDDDGKMKWRRVAVTAYGALALTAYASNKLRKPVKALSRPKSPAFDDKGYWA